MSEAMGLRRFLTSAIFFLARTNSFLPILALRLHPIPIAHSRVTQVDILLPAGGGSGGHSPIFVSKGWTVTTPGSALHRLQKTFGDDANLFRPDR